MMTKEHNVVVSLLTPSRSYYDASYIIADKQDSEFGGCSPSTEAGIVEFTGTVSPAILIAMVNVHGYVTK